MPGKTVAMTTVALTLVMAHCGMPVACGAQTALPWLRGLTSAIGDLQDLSRDLSTFTAHLSRLAEMASRAENGWWFFIDEIASGTDPVEEPHWLEVFWSTFATLVLAAL